MFTQTTHRSKLRNVAPASGLLLAMAIGPVSAQDLGLRAALLTSEGAAKLAGAPAGASLDLRYRVTERHHLFADVAPVHGFEGAGAIAPVSARVGVEWQPAKSTLGLEHGAIGMQLDSGARVSLKARHGGPMLYVRNRF
jgi:hypothetical protein